MIPKVFHFVFGLREQTEPFHLMYYLCLASCLNVNRPSAIHFHYHHEPWGEWWERIKHRLTLRRINPTCFVTDYHYSDAEVARYRYAHVADFVRLQVLLDEGGIYADIDTLFLRPIPETWHEHAFILGEERSPIATLGAGSLCNAWIGSAPGSEFCRRWLHDMHQAFDGSWSNHSTLLPFRLAQQHPDLLHIEPESSFYALDWTPKGINKLLLQNTSLPETARSLHLWNHLWFSETRHDFSHFHAGDLTIDYVRHASTTYARHARPHLPDDAIGSHFAYSQQRRQRWLRYPFRSVRSAWWPR